MLILTKILVVTTVMIIIQIGIKLLRINMIKIIKMKIILVKDINRNLKDMILMLL